MTLIESALIWKYIINNIKIYNIYKIFKIYFKLWDNINKVTNLNFKYFTEKILM